MDGAEGPITLPATRRFREVLGIRTAYYRSEGAPAPGSARKEAVLLLHGGAPGVCSELNWFRNFGVLADAGHEVIAYDQPGFGHSALPDDHGIDFRYRHLVAFLQSLELDAVHLVGNSIGGLLCTLLAHRNPDALQLKSLVLSAPYPYFDPPAAVDERLRQHRARLSSVEPTFDSVRKLCLNTFNQAHAVTDDIVGLRLAMLQGRRWDAYQARSANSREFQRQDIGDKPLAIPTLLVWGVEDRSLPHEIGIEAMKYFPTGRFLFLTQCGHWPQTEQADAFNQAMLGFLAAHR